MIEGPQPGRGRHCTAEEKRRLVTAAMAPGWVRSSEGPGREPRSAPPLVSPCRSGGDQPTMFRRLLLPLLPEFVLLSLLEGLKTLLAGLKRLVGSLVAPMDEELL